MNQLNLNASEMRDAISAGAIRGAWRRFWRGGSNPAGRARLAGTAVVLGVLVLVSGGLAAVRMMPEEIAAAPTATARAGAAGHAASSPATSAQPRTVDGMEISTYVPTTPLPRMTDSHVQMYQGPVGDAELERFNETFAGSRR